MRGKLLVLFIVAVASAVLDVPEYEEDEKEWAKFKQQFDRHYSPDEEIYRFAIFKATLKGIKDHNEKYKRNEVTWTQGINQFADLTHDEFVNRYTMARWVKQHQEAGHPGHSSPPHALTAVGAVPPAGVKGRPSRTYPGVGIVLPPGYQRPPTLDNDEEMESDDKEWEKFKTKFHKQYASPSEESYRFAIFKLALPGIRTHNKKYQNHEVSWRQGINQFSDMTQQEFESRNNLKPPQGAEHDGEKLGNDDEEWMKFKRRFNKHYSSPKEGAYRKTIFLATLKAIRDHNEKYNRQETSWRQGVNQFADLTQQEFEMEQRITKGGVQEQKPEDQHEPSDNIEEVEDDDEAWEKFKKEFDRHYPTSDEENYRKGIFMVTLNGVREHNKKYKNKEVSYSQGINQFADLTQQEFATRYTMKDFVRRRAGLILESQAQPESSSVGPAGEIRRKKVAFVKSPIFVQYS